MQPITRINANDPVIFSDMNLRFNEIEARDNEQQEQINVLNKKFSVGQVDALNGWVKAWTTDAVGAFRYEINGGTIHVKALLGSGTVTSDTIITILPKGAKDEWIYGMREDGLTSKFYLDWDGNLKVNSVPSGTGKVIHLDFSYRKR